MNDLDMDFNFAAESNLSDAYPSTDDYIIEDIKSSDEYKALDLVNSQKDRNTAKEMLTPNSDFWEATIDANIENRCY